MCDPCKESKISSLIILFILLYMVQYYHVTLFLTFKRFPLVLYQKPEPINFWCSELIAYENATY